MTGILGGLRRAVTFGRRGARSAPPAKEVRRRQPNLFEAAAVFVAASATEDPARAEEASGWVSPEALSFGVSELACRAVATLARERGESPQAVARALLGLPASPKEPVVEHHT
ncbi:hypothetical protein ACFVWY_29845 [Streptomyces sp. NPDC058195]|uniref:hypothetical protein n=1 Tax=Streptomyces sp. NPDC058195 TaxID=3346375 RepID=UPI0036EAFF8F